MTDNELKAIRQNIACPQFGDDHYGSWGALNLNQRRAIKRMLDHINILEAEVERLQKHIKEGIDLAKQLPEMIRLSKTEAIKEFAERVKDTFDQYGAAYDCYAIIDKLVKEMVGATKC